MKAKKIAVLGAGGFIGHHLVAKLRAQGHWVRGVDIAGPCLYNMTQDRNAHEFMTLDLRDPVKCNEALFINTAQVFDEVYQLAADMGGAGFIFTGDNDAEIMHNSAMINLNVLEACVKYNIPKVFYSSSACIYPERNQMNPDTPDCAEHTAYPAAPDSEYGWEKLFSERMYAAYARNHGIEVRIARFHNIYGPEGTWTGGREKAPAAMCRKVAEAPDGGSIEVWGDGLQTRSFLYIDDCLEGVERLMASDCSEPLNIGSEEMVTINDLAEIAIEISGKQLAIDHIDGPLGVRGRNSSNDLIKEKLGWAPPVPYGYDDNTSFAFYSPLRDGMYETYKWIDHQVRFYSVIGDSK